MTQKEIVAAVMERIGDPTNNPDAINGFITVKRQLYASDFYRIATDAVNLGNETFAVIDESPMKALLLTLELSSRIHRLNLEQFRQLVEIGDRTSASLQSGREKANQGTSLEIEERHHQWQLALNQLMRSDKSISFRQASKVIATRFNVTDRNVRRYTKPPRTR